MLKKSPSGSLCPYYYMDGELHPLKYGSYFDNKEQLFEIINAEEEFILKSSGTNNRRIWIDLYETTVDDEVAKVLAGHLQAIRHKIFNLCLVGCSSAAQRAIKKKMKSAEMDLYYLTRYFDDPEIAKQWLLGKV
ncbi:hypothetical protein HNQ56_003078 [Anaerotaenia torta]|uniref:hypothetical protein n=1 Tax=Anaerotaenia torta TaxID=433293 RepID=UPI003D21C503